MKIAILSSAPAGGAGIAAYRIFEALSAVNGYEVDIFDINALGAVDLSVSPQISATNKKITNTHFTVDYASKNRQWVINSLSEYDIINIQWASYLISLSEILALAELGKQILFTLHDFYYITGGCHYPAGCFGYLDRCIACPQVDEYICNQSAVINSLALKRKMFSHANVHLAAPSAFVVDSAIQSGIIPRNRAHVLRNAYNAISVPNMDWEENVQSILLIADSFDEERKGLALAVEAIKLAANDPASETHRFQLHLVGGVDAEVIRRLEGTGIDVVTHGHIKHHEKLVRIFNYCQFVLSCSFEDNWPNIFVESASYGCIPIVGRWHGCEEFATTFSVGFVADNYSSNSFSNAIVSAFSLSVNNRKQLAKRLIQNVRKIHAYTNASQAYRYTFKKMLFSLEEREDEHPKKKNTLFSQNHLITNIRLEYERSKAKDKIFCCEVTSNPSPFGGFEKSDSTKMVIKSLDEIFGEGYINDELIRKVPTNVYGLKSYYIRVYSRAGNSHAVC